MSQRAPANVRTDWLRVTRPMTVPSRIVSYRFARCLLVHNAYNHPSHGTLFVFDRFACGHAIGGNNDSLMHRCPVGINRHLRNALRLARVVDRLANNQAPALKAWMLPGGGQIAFNAS